MDSNGVFAPKILLVSGLRRNDGSKVWENGSMGEWKYGRMEVWENGSMGEWKDYARRVTRLCVRILSLIKGRSSIFFAVIPAQAGIQEILTR